MQDINYNFPEGTTIDKIQKDGKDFYSISYASKELIDTPFGLMPERAFSTGNYDLEIAVQTFSQTLLANGYNFETKLWQ